jgi:hypothetical protein
VLWPKLPVRARFRTGGWLGSRGRRSPPDGAATPRRRSSRSMSSQSNNRPRPFDMRREQPPAIWRWCRPRAWPGLMSPIDPDLQPRFPRIIRHATEGGCPCLTCCYKNCRDRCAVARSRRAGRVTRPAAGPLAQQSDTRCRSASRGEARGSNAHGCRTGARRRPDRNAAPHRTDPAAVSRTHRQVSFAADRERRRYLRHDAGGHAALAKGDITPGEAATIAGVVETFARAIEITERRAFAVDPLQVLALGDCDETEGYDEADGV